MHLPAEPTRNQVSCLVAWRSVLPVDDVPEAVRDRFAGDNVNPKRLINVACL